MTRTTSAPRRLLLPLFIIAVLAVIIWLVIGINSGALGSIFGSASVTVEWSTASELNTAGFNLYRGDTQDGPFTRINPELIPASPDPLIGGSYVFTDTNVTAGRTYYYQLEDVETSGAATVQGVVEVKADGGLDPASLIMLIGAVVLVLSIMVLRQPRR